LYEQVILEHFAADELMMLLGGPRQCGKTTCAEMVAAQYSRSLYLNWDERSHRETILAGSEKIAELAELDQLQKNRILIIFDELHKYKGWKQFLKGFYDLYRHQVHIIVTGSSRLNIFRQGGDSLMGRYFSYRMHPLSVAECISPSIPAQEIRLPAHLKEKNFMALYQHGGYPKPYLKDDLRFSNRWQRLRLEQLVREDIRDGTRIQELAQLEMLVAMLKHQGAKQLNYAKLASKIRVSVDTISRWITVLASFYYCFTVKPWHKNITRALVKEPKIYLWDWSLLEDEGSRFENFIASHLLKAVHFWTDMGYGDYELFYIRTLDKKEVDFLVTKDKQPWFLVEAKRSKQPINKYLMECHRKLQTKYAFQVCLDMPFVGRNCFEEPGPIIVPARTFLSQLV